MKEIFLIVCGVCMLICLLILIIYYFEVYRPLYKQFKKDFPHAKLEERNRL